MSSSLCVAAKDDRNKYHCTFKKKKKKKETKMMKQILNIILQIHEYNDKSHT